MASTPCRISIARAAPARLIHPMPAAPRSALLCYNTVERMLKGDFFHTVDWADVSAELSAFPADWPLAGIGTTNWFRRNGETMLTGTAGAPRLLWSDPEGEAPMSVINLLEDKPAGAGPALVSPSMADDGSSPPLPFLAVGVCNPATALVWECGGAGSIHTWVAERMVAENIGLAAVRVQARARALTVCAAFYLPLEGLDLSHGYNAANNLKLAEFSGDEWDVGGIYAANPTLQKMISVEGLPLHLHGSGGAPLRGGHVAKLAVESARVTVWPLQDLVLRIRNLDQAWLPVRNLASPQNP